MNSNQNNIKGIEKNTKTNDINIQIHNNKGKNIRSKLNENLNDKYLTTIIIDNNKKEEEEVKKKKKKKNDEKNELEFKYSDDINNNKKKYERMVPKNKKIRKIETDEKEIKEKFKKLIQFQNEIDKINNSMFIENIELEYKYYQKKKQIFQERNKLITEIENFWISVLIENPYITSKIIEDDMNLLKKLQNIEYEFILNNESFGHKIIFTFHENKYIYNKNLTKKIIYSKCLMNLETVEQSGINWKEGYKITKENINDNEKKVNGKSRKRKHEEIEFSFFKYFEKNNEDDEYITNILRTEIIQNPMKFFSK